MRYAQGMWKAWACVLTAAVVLFGQSTDPVTRLNPVLQRAMTGDASTDELAEAIVSLAPPLQRIFRNDITRLAAALSGVMQGHKMTDAETTALSECIVGLLQGDGASNFALAVRFRDTLNAMGIVDPKTDLIVRRFVDVGGPDDPPVRPSPLVVPYRAK
ncbi:MAG TPA: hypothetical protein VN519_09485 [Bryobacteraceae bacterium]|nr:hypothetical protein [Bryobacteraceae bacterium]